MTYDRIDQFMQWIKTHAHDPLPMDSTIRLNEYMEVLSTIESPIMYKDFAIKGIGMLILKYNYNLVVISGALPLLKDQLLSNNDILIYQSIRTLNYIVIQGGSPDLFQNHIQDALKIILSKQSLPLHIKQHGSNLYFSILDKGLTYSFD